MLGYVGIPLDETLDADGFFRTGDGGYVDDEGRLFWEGRLTDVIKTGGANVSPLEIDEALVQHPGVKVARRSAYRMRLSVKWWSRALCRTMVRRLKSASGVLGAAFGELQGAASCALSR